MRLLPLKEVKITNKVNVLLLLLSQFLHLFFTLNSVVFVEGGARIFLAPVKSSLFYRNIQNAQMETAKNNSVT